MTDLVISLHRAVGDTVVLTAFLRDLHRAHPGRFRVWAAVHFPELLRHSPHVHAAGTWRGRRWPDSFRVIRAEYGAGIVRQKYEPVHFLAWFHRDFEEKTGIRVPLTDPMPDLHLAGAELEPPLIGRHWVLMAGGKSDVPVKVWSRAAWQRTADRLRAAGLGVVQVGAQGRGHIQFDLAGTLNLVGKLNLRELLRLIRHADGVICGLTSGMHIAAALARPCVVVAGGREAWWWEAYHGDNVGLGPHAAELAVPHRYLHTIGLLPCGHGKHGCWRNRVVPPDPHDLICDYPEVVGEQTLPLCMKMIGDSHAVEAALSYYEDGTLPPIAVPPDFVVPPPVFRPPAGFRPVVPASDPDYDHPAIGGRLTAFVLLYGDHHELHRRCLDALILTTPRDRVEVRVLSNQLGPASVRYVTALASAGTVVWQVANPDNPGKYPVMRAAFRDPARPIETEYLLWLDDDTICDGDPGWLRRLVQLIAREHPGGARMFGPPYHIGLEAGQADWIRAAAWYRGRPFRDRQGRETPRGNRVHFAVGSFWCLHTETMRECDIPDPRIGHNGGDVMIGEQLHQMGHAVRPFSASRSLVNYGSAPRRGRSEKPAGATK